MLKAIAKQVLPTSVWSFLRSKKIKNLVQNHENYIREGSYCGHQLKVSIEDPLGHGWYGQDWEPLSEIALLKDSKLKEGAKVFDLGAHQCVVAMVLAKEVGDSGKVLAIEANRHNYNVCENNKKLNSMDQLEILHAAVGQENGEIEFSEDLNGAIKNNQTTTESTKVKAYSINHLIDKHFNPDVIFMDIEGFEVHALKGASKAFELKSDWFVEVHGPELIGRFGGTVQEVMNFFKDKGYNLKIAKDETDYVPYSDDNALLNDRFYLVATCE